MSELLEARPRRTRPILLLAGLVVLLAACGGGGGGGGGSVDHFIHALVVNAAEADATVTYTDAAGTPTDQVVESCTAPVLEFPLTDPFQIAIDGTVLIDSAQLPDGVPGLGESDIIVKIDIAKDGTAEFDSVRPGRTISPPARSAYCPSLPG